MVLEGVLRESPYPGPGDMRLGPNNGFDYKENPSLNNYKS